MKKVLSIIMILAISLSLLSGCKSKAQGSGRGGQGGRGMQGQFKAADLAGEVTEISGNEITIKVIEMPAFGNGGNRGNGQNQTGNDGKGNQNNSGNQNGNGGQQRQVNYTGETKKITIPDGVEISSFARGQNGSADGKKELKDIQKGNTLQIWFSDKDKETISRVSIMNIPQNNQK